MNQYSVGLTAIPIVARTQQRPADLSKEIASKEIDEMLVDMPSATARNFWIIAGPPLEQLSQKCASPFGDW